MKRTLLILSGVISSFLCFAQRPFITTWKTDNAGVSKPNQIFLNATGTGYSVSWVNTTNAADTGSATLNGSDTVRFATAGIYKVYITPGNGTFTALQMLENNYSGDYNKLLSIEQWGDINWSTFVNAYFNCANLVMNATDTPKLDSVTSMQNAFAQCRSLVGNAAMSNWDVSHITNMIAMFNGSHFNQDISSWNVSHVQLIDDMFSYDSLFNQPIGSWDMSRVTESGEMFSHAIAFNQPLNNWNMSSNTFMDNMFSHATSFNQPLDSWNVGKVFSMYAMFYGASSFNQPLNDWNVSSVTIMNTMFLEAAKFNQPLDKWDVSHVTDMLSMFGSDSAFNQPIGSWNVGSVSDMRGMFSSAVAFNQPIGSWNVSNVSGMDAMFSGAAAFNQPIGNWDVSRAAGMSSMFSNASSFNQPIGSWNVSKVSGMYGMFYGASVFNQPIGNWNVSKVSNLNQMFKNASAFNQNIGAWNMGRVSFMQGMLDSSGMSCSNYGLTLQGWADNTSTPNNLELGAAALTYDSAMAGAAHDSLTGIKGWTIDGDKAGNCSLLPVSLISFTANKQGNNAILQWKTANETNMVSFTVQRSTDGIHFATFGSVKAAGNSSEEKNYTYTDYSINQLGVSKLYYRLVQQDNNGLTHNSAIARIDITNGKLSITLSPNPVRNSIDIYSPVMMQNAVIRIADMSGKVVYTSRTNLSAGTTFIVDASAFAKGIYFVTVQNGTDKQVMKLVKE